MNGDFAVGGGGSSGSMWQRGKKMFSQVLSYKGGSLSLARTATCPPSSPFSATALLGILTLFFRFLHPRVAAFHLQDYNTAKVALAECQTLSPEQRTLDSWIRKNDQELAKLPKPVAAPAAATQTETPVTTANSTPVTSPVVASTSSMAATPAPAALTPAALRVRYIYIFLPPNNTVVEIFF